MVQMLLKAILITLPVKKGVCLETRPSIFAQSDHLKPKLSLCCLFAIKRERLSPLFICVFYSLWPHKKIYLKEKKIWIIEVVIF